MRKKALPAQPEKAAPAPLVRTFPPGTHCREAARELAVPLIECPRRPTMRAPFALLVDGEPVWLVFSCHAQDDCESQHQTVIASLRRGVEQGRRMALLTGRNEPNPFDAGVPIWALYTDQGSVARHDQRFQLFWTDRAYVYRDLRVPGPAQLPDEELSPMAAANRCFLLPPTEPYDFSDRRSIHCAAYHPGERRDPMAPWRAPQEAKPKQGQAKPPKEPSARPTPAKPAALPKPAAKTKEPASGLAKELAKRRRAAAAAVRQAGQKK